MIMRNVPFHWRRYRELYSLQGSRCETCGGIFFPVRKICPNCRREGKLSKIAFSGRGKVYTYSVIRVPPEGFEAFTPYVVALVQLDEGPKVMSQIVDCAPEDVYIGMPVESCFRRLRVEGSEGIIIYGFKFRPIDGALRKQAPPHSEACFNGQARTLT
jgi:uncharacterized OB-fold protein